MAFMAPVLPWITAIGGVAGGVSAVTSMQQQRKEEKKATKERANLATQQAEERKKRYARLTQAGASEVGSIMSSGGNTTGQAVQRKELLGQ